MSGFEGRIAGIAGSGAVSSPRTLESRRPYFVWGYDITEEEIHQILTDGNQTERAWVITRILEHWKWDDIWRYLTPDRIRENFDHLRFRLPQDREMWAYALKRWARGG